MKYQISRVVDPCSFHRKETYWGDVAFFDAEIPSPHKLNESDTLVRGDIKSRPEGDGHLVYVRPTGAVFSINERAKQILEEIPADGQSVSEICHVFEERGISRETTSGFLCELCGCGVISVLSN